MSILYFFTFKKFEIFWFISVENIILLLSKSTVINKPILEIKKRYFSIINGLTKEEKLNLLIIEPVLESIIYVNWLDDIIILLFEFTILLPLNKLFVLEFLKSFKFINHSTLRFFKLIE